VMEIAEILKVNPMTVRNWISREELPALRVGSRRVRVRRTDFDAFIARSQAPGPTGTPKNGSPAGSVGGVTGRVGVGRVRRVRASRGR
jgi:excisionase family DNA binding protein